MGGNDNDHNTQSMCHCGHVPTSLVITAAFHVTTSEDGHKIASLLNQNLYRDAGPLRDTGWSLKTLVPGHLSTPPHQPDINNISHFVLRQNS